MRICYICGDPGIPIFGRKGCSTHVRETILTLQQMGHEVKLVTPNAKGDTSSKSKFDIVEVPAPASKKWGFDLRHIVLNRRMHAAMQNLVKTWRPEAIYERYSLYSRTGTAIEMQHKLPRMLEINAFLTKEQAGRIRFSWLAKRVERGIFRRAKRLIVVSEPLRHDLVAQGVAGERIIKMPMAVDLDAFSPEADGESVMRRHGLEGRFIFGYVGTLGGWHGISLMYDMARELIRREAPPFAFLIVGGDKQKIEMHRRKTAEFGLQDVMHFIGSVPFEQVPEHIAAMHAAIVPDMTYWSSPAKLFEYQACGVPALAPDFPSIHETMGDGQEGFIFKPRNTNQMADFGLRMMRDEAMRRQMGLRCRRRAVEEHSWQRNGAEIMRIFNEMIG